MEKKKIFFASDEQIIDLVIPIPNLVLIIFNTGRPRTSLLCPSVLARLQFKFFILTFCPSLTTANSGLQKRQGAKNRFLPTYSVLCCTVLYCTVLVHIEDVQSTVADPADRRCEVVPKGTSKTKKQKKTDRHNEGALGLLVSNTQNLSSGFNLKEAH